MATSVVFQESPKGPRAETIKAMVDERVASQAAKLASEAARDAAATSAGQASGSASAAASAASASAASAGAAAEAETNAAVSAQEAGTLAAEAEAQRAAAEAAKLGAETARDAAVAAGDIFPSTAAGIAVVPVGGYFSVAISGTSFLSLYRVDAGPTAVLVNTYLSAVGVGAAIAEATEQTGPYFYNGTRFLMVVRYENGTFIPFMNEDGRPVLMDSVTGEIESVASSRERAAEIDTKIAEVATIESAVFVNGERMRCVVEIGGGFVMPLTNEAGLLVSWNPATGQMSVVGESQSSMRTVNILTAPSIAWLTNSLAHGAYNLPGKFWLQILSGLTDWQIHNFSFSGYEVEDNYNDLQANVVVGNDVYGLRDLSPAYVVIADTANSAWRWRDASDYLASVEQLSRAIKALGAVPIIQTEPRNNPPEILAGLIALATREGMPMVDVSSARKVMGGDLPTNFNQGGISGGVDFTHPGTRTQWILVEAMRRALDLLPRPAASIKLWRARDTEATMNGLLYDDQWGRFALWTPLPVACRDLDGASQVNFDQLQNAVTFTVTEDAHLNLANGAATAFANYALLSVVVDGVASTLDEVRIDTGVTDGAVTAYVRSPLQPLGYDPHDVSQWAVVEVAAFPAITPGATYSNGVETLTYVGNATHPDGTRLVIFSPAIATVRGALTYTKQSGTGDASFAGTGQFPGRHPAFYSALTAPRAAWEPVDMSAGIVTLTGAQALQGAMAGDRIDLLMVKTGTITMSRSPSVSWTEAREAKRLPSPVAISSRGTLLADMLMTDVDWVLCDASGAALGAPSPAAPDDGWVPPGVSVVVPVSNASRLSTEVDLAPDDLEPGWAVVEVWARHAPALFDGVTFPGTSEITLTTLDHRQIALRLTEAAGNGRVHFRGVERIGLAWWRVQFRVALPPAPLWGAAARRIEIYSPDGTVLIGRVRIVKE